MSQFLVGEDIFLSDVNGDIYTLFTLLRWDLVGDKILAGIRGPAVRAWDRFVFHRSQQTGYTYY